MKNIFSYGNYWSEIDLNKRDLTVVIGANGVGKSTLLLDSLCFVLFGKPFRKIKVTKSPIVNSITKKELVVELTFSIGNDEYKIIRGLKPTIFEMYKNNVLIPQDNYYQDFLEKKILCCNMKTFCQVVILGAEYKPFLSLSNPERRVVVENILEYLEIFSTMNTLLVEEMKETNKSIIELEHKKNLNIDRRKIYEKALADSKQDNEKKIEEYKKEIARFGQEINNLYNVVKEKKASLLSSEREEEVKKIVEGCISKSKDINQKLAVAKNKLNEFVKESEFFSNHDVCPTCHQNIDKLFIENKIRVISEQMSKYNDAILQLEQTQNANKQDWVYNEELIKKNTLLGNEIRNIEYYDIGNYKNDIEKFTNRIREEEKEKHNEMNTETLKALEDEYTEINQKLDILYQEKSAQQVLQRVLRDDGAKSQEVDRYIDKINELINKFLIEMDFFCSFFLDKEFNEVIKSRYRDEFSYESFSSGQKLRIDLAILFAWRDLAQTRNSISFNVLIFDELLSGSLDKAGVNDMINILKANKKKENIFLITHDEASIELVDDIIEIKVENGFSRICQDKYKEE